MPILLNVLAQFLANSLLAAGASHHGSEVSMHVQTYEPLGIGAGSRIDNRYDVVRKLGSGGMSAVYEVVDRSLENTILALKLFSPQLVSSENALKRFRQEVLISRKLTHENIVRTFEFGVTSSNQFYMTMERVRGVTLEQLARMQPGARLPVDKASAILRRILLGVQYAHEMGVVHRDLKPGNILISEDGDIKITDFGLALTQDLNAKLTTAGECVGTPHYMCPEQVQGREVDSRADIYALGIIAYELVMGAVPFDDEAWFGLANKVINDSLPTMSSKKNRIPEWYEEMVQRATAKDAVNRFQFAAEMLAVIEANISSETGVMPPLTSARTDQLLARPTQARVMDPPRGVLPPFNPYRFATIALPALLLIFVGIVAATVTRKKADEVAESLKLQHGIIADVTDTLGKLQDAVIFAHTHKQEIDSFLQKGRPEAVSSAGASSAAPVSAIPENSVAPDLKVSQ